MTSQEWHSSRERGEEEEDLFPKSLVCPLLEMRFSPNRSTESRPEPGEETLWALKSSGFKIVRGSWTVWFRGNLADSRSCALAADRTSHCCDSRRLWRKPYLVKVFVAVTQRDQPAINSAGGGREINAYIILRAAKQSNKLRSLLRVKTVNRISLTFT